MAIVSLWFSAAFLYLMLPWKDNVNGKLLSYTGCKLFHRIADCSHLQLTSVPQDLPIDIEELLLDFNQIQILHGNSLLRYQDLTILSMQSNHLELIETGALEGLKKLEVLSLQNNNIYINYNLVSAALRITSALKKMDLSTNGLTVDMVAILVKNQTSLEKLCLDNNIIMRLDQTVFEDLIHLKDLSLQRNFIYEIEEGTFEGLGKLRSLNLAYNILPCVDNFQLMQIQMLNLSFNNIEWFQSRETDVQFHLEMLDISNNKMLFFPILPRQNHLHTLLLSNNKMRFYANVFDAISSKAYFLIVVTNITSVVTVDLWNDNIHSNLSMLRYLDMNNNLFTYFPAGFFASMVSLSSLKINWNCLQTFSVSAGEINSLLDELDLSNNELSELQTDNISEGFMHLGYLNLSGNNLNNLPKNIFRQMNRIHTLDMSYNLLRLCFQPDSDVITVYEKCVDIRHVPSLRYLYMSGCKMELGAHSVFSGNTLTHLDLSHNFIKGIKFLLDIVTTLQTLSLRGSLQHNVSIDFSTFVSLTALDISENTLTTFPESLIDLSLHYLDLRRNNLISLPLHNTYQRLLGSLKTVYISSNPFDCCELNWLTILNKFTIIPDLQMTTCNFSNNYFLMHNLPDPILSRCQWKNGQGWLYLLLTLPLCLTLLVALLLLFLTFKHTFLQTLKRRCRRSAGY